MTTKSEATREVLVETALRLFRERGYEKTTMRLIATEAGVSQGNAYYYFDGKDAFVQELYRRIQVEHRRLAEPRLREGAPLAQGGWIAVYTDITQIRRTETLLQSRSAELSEQVLAHAERLSAANRQLAATNAALEEAGRGPIDWQLPAQVTGE